MSETDLPDGEGAIRAWLRADPNVTALFGQRIFFGVDDPSAYPVALVQRVGGGQDGTSAEGLHDLALIQVDVVGNVHDKASAFAAMSVVMNSLNELRNYVHETTRVLGTNVQSWAYIPDVSERARYTLTLQAFCVPA